MIISLLISLLCLLSPRRYQNTPQFRPSISSRNPNFLLPLNQKLKILLKIAKNKIEEILKKIERKLEFKEMEKFWKNKEEAIDKVLKRHEQEIDNVSLPTIFMGIAKTLCKSTKTRGFEGN